MALTGTEFRGPLGLVVDNTGALVTVASGSSMGSVVAGWLTDADGRLVTASSGQVFPGPIPGIPCSASGAVVTGASDGTPFGARYPGLLTNASGALVTGSGPVTSMQNGMARNAAGALVTAGGGLGYDATVLADTPVAYWPLSDTTGTAAADASAGGANPGAYSGGFTLNQTGIGDTKPSVLFDGTSGLVTIPDAAALRLTGDLSIEIWVNPTNFSNYRLLVTKCLAGGGTFNPYEYRLNTSTGQPLLNSFTGSATNGSAGTAAPSAGAFTHMVVTRAAATGTCAHYRNGAANGSTTGVVGPYPDSGRPVLIGQRDDSLAFFIGRLAKVALYSSVLSPAQVAAHYAARNTP